MHHKFEVNHLDPLQNTQVSEEKEFKYAFWYQFDSKEALKNVKSEVWCYKGDNVMPRWKDTDPGGLYSRLRCLQANPNSLFLPGNYSKLCTVEMDLSHLPIVPKPKANGEAGEYWFLEYTYVLCFSAVELRAQITWKEGVCQFLFAGQALFYSRLLPSIQEEEKRYVHCAPYKIE